MRKILCFAVVVLLALSLPVALASGKPSDLDIILQYFEWFDTLDHSGNMDYYHEIGDYAVSVYDNYGDLWTIAIYDERPFHMGLFNRATNEMVIPLENYSIQFTDDGKIIGTINEHVQVGDTFVSEFQNYIFDTDGNREPLDIEGSLLVLDNGLIIASKEVIFDAAEGSFFPTARIWLTAIYDSEFNMLMDYIIENSTLSSIWFYNDLAVICAGSTEYIYISHGQSSGVDGKYGIINSKAEWVLEPKYDYLDYYGYGKYYATLDGNLLFIDANDNDLHLEYFSYDPSDWAAPEVNKAIELGLYRGLNRNVRMSYYACNWNITRQQFCELAVDLYKVAVGELPTVDQTDTFTDTNNADILAAYELGIIKGYSDGTFRPFADITRQEAAIMLSRLASVLGIEPTAEPLAFTDESTMYAEGIAAVHTVSAMGVMNGVGQERFAPNEHYTVEQAVCTMVRLYDCKENNIYDIALDLFEKAVHEIILLSTDDPSLIIRKNLRDDITLIYDETIIYGVPYYKTSASYYELYDFYSRIFTGEALNWIMSTKFAELDDVLYCSPSGGATGWNIVNTEVNLIEQIDNRYIFEATFNTKSDTVASETITSKFEIIKNDNGYRIKSIDYSGYLPEMSK